MTLLLLPILLAACNGSGESVNSSFTTGFDDAGIPGNETTGDSSTSDDSSEESVATIARTLTGSVGDGPIIGATIRVFDKNRNLLETGVSDDSASYRLTTHAAAESYPLVIEASGGIDLVTNAPADFTLKSVAMSATESNRVNINPFTSIITETAFAMPGGLTRSNFTEATHIVLDKFSFGLDTQLVPNPIETTIDATNVAAIVKASEALGEVIRRTHTALQTAGHNYSHDQVLTSIAADFTDGSLDGMGANGSTPLVAATTTATSAQVLTEALSNQLHVESADATALMDQSIRTTQPDATQFTGSVRITEAMVKQSHLAIQALQVVHPSTALTEIDNKLALINPNHSPDEVAELIPVNLSKNLNETTSRVSRSDETQLQTINTVVREDIVLALPAPVIVAGPAPETTTETTQEPTVETAPEPAPAPNAEPTPAAVLASVDGYSLYMGSSQDNVSPMTELQIGSSIEWTPHPLLADKTYYFAVIARDADGTALATGDGIAGYRVYMGSYDNDLSSTFTLSNGANGIYHLPDAPAGTYYLSFAAYDSNGIESPSSNLARIELR